MSAGIISVGDELISGQVQDSNFPFLARQLGQLGITVQSHLTVGDCHHRLTEALGHLCQSCQLVLLTGGLGPTSDDITRYALSEVLCSPLKMDQQALEQIEQHFVRLNRPMTEVNRIQAMIPASAKIIENSWGTAPGIAARLGQTHIFALPGVPHEMRAMFSQKVEPELRQLGLAGKTIITTRLHCCGTGESNVFTLIQDLMERAGNPLVGITVQDGIISISITAQADSPQAARRLLNEKCRLIAARLGEYLFGQDEQTLAQVVGELLTRKKQTLALAESCTAGLIAKLLTDIPGASKFFVAGVAAYADEAKSRLLGVPEELLRHHGAVSPECARAMAAGAMACTGVDWALAVTGIAGPEGSTNEKPVGLVYIGLAQKDFADQEKLIAVKEWRFAGSRQHIRARASVSALDMLRRALLQKQKQ